MSSIVNFFAAHKGFFTTMIGMGLSVLAPKLGIPESDLSTFVMSVCGLAGAYVTSHNIKKGMAMRADIASTRPE